MAVIRAEYYTDPYCAWSWALEPTWQEITERFDEELDVQYFMLPLVEDVYAGSKGPEDIAKAWERIGRLTGVPIDASAWRRKTPVESTLPGCRAAVAAMKQGQEAAGRFIRALRPALMTRGKVADERDVLKAAAIEAELDLAEFERALDDPGLDARIKHDQERAKRAGIGSTPAVILTNGCGDRVVIEGPRDRELFERAISVLKADSEAEECGSPVTVTPLMHEAVPGEAEVTRQPMGG